MHRSFKNLRAGFTTLKSNLRVRIFLVAALCSLVLIFLGTLAPASFSANPAAGTISESSPAVRWARQLKTTIGLSESVNILNQETPCTLPGIALITDPAGDTGTGTLGTAPGTPAQDITQILIAEPPQPDGERRIAATMRVADISTLPASGIWRVFFAVGATTYFVGAFNDPVTGTVQYTYGTSGTVTTTLGPADSGFIDTANNSITILISNTQVGSPGPGAALSGIYGRTQTLVGAGAAGGATPTHDLAPNTAPGSGTATYTLVGNESCGPTPTPTPTPTPQSACVPPGINVVTDTGTNDAADGLPVHDIISTSVSYPFTGTTDPDKLIFTIKVASLAALTPSSFYFTSFTIDGAPEAQGNVYGVRMVVDEAGATRFESYQAGASNAGTVDGRFVSAFSPAESGSNFSPDGTITIVVRPSSINVQPGQTLTRFNGAVAQTAAGVATGILDWMPTGSATTNPTRTNTSFLVQSNQVCNPSPTPTPSPTATPSPTPTPTPAPGPRYLVYQPPAGMGTSAAEPSLGVNRKTGKVMYIAGLETLRVTFDECTQGAQWEDVSFFTTSQRTLDPILFTDNIPGNTHPDRTFVSQLAGKTSLMAYTDNDGGVDGTAPGDWTPSQGSGVNSGVDHQTIGGGPFHAPLTRDSNGPLYPHAIYYCSQDIADAYCALSVDGGQTFGPAVPIYTVLQCGGLHGSVQVGPDGTVYVPNKSCGGRQAVVVSEDNGITWQIRPVPTSTAGRWDPFVGIATDGTLYFGYGAQNGRPRVAVSHDHGLSWTNDQVVGMNFGDSGIRDTAFPSAVAGDPERAAFAFLGTTNPGANAVWSLFIAHTYDGGLTWTTVNATGDDPVQRGTVCSGGTLGCPNGDRNLLDFNDVTMDAEGRVVAAIADGCIGPCVQSGPNSFTALATIARQSGGKRLLKQFDPPDLTEPSSPVLTTARRDNFGVHLEWTEPDNGGSPITGYHVYRQPDGGEEELIATTVANDRDYVDRSVDPFIIYRYRVKAVNAIGESSDCAGLVLPIDSGPPNPCVTPGVHVLSDPEGDAVPPLAVSDIKSLSVAELFDPANPSAAKMTFTLKMAGGGVLPPNAQWYIIWKRVNVDANADREYVAMKTNPLGTSIAPIFVYGDISPPSVNAPTDRGSADSGTYDEATGAITITISNSKIENIGPGQTLSNLEVRVFNRGDASGLLPVTQAGAQDFTTFGQQYVVFGNSFCRPQTAPTAALSASPSNGVAPLTVNFDASASSDADAGDTITEYELDFGDGSPVVEQNSPSFTHTYGSPGEYLARLTVRDSRNSPSSNVATVTITVTEANNPPIAALSASPTSGVAPLTVNFDGSGSSDPDAGDAIVSYSFNFGDGSPPITQSSATTSHIYNAPGTYTAQLTVTDSRGAQSANVASVAIEVSAAPACFDETDSQIAYSNGWHLRSSSSASGGQFRYHVGDSPHHFARLDFEVPANAIGSITYHFAKSTKGGTADIYLDGVFRQTVSYAGSNGSMHQPEFNPAFKLLFENLSPGSHRLEIKNMSGVVYVDAFCLVNASSSAQPASGPGTTESQSGNAAAGETSSSNYQMQSGSQEISVVAESNINVPFKLILVDPSGLTLQTADSAAGLAVINRPVTQGGTYVIKVVNLSLGPLQFTTNATPLVSR